VLCVDEKSQIQALDRTHPLLPMRPGQVERRSHDDERHRTTSLFAALDIATGHVIGRCYQRHRAVEFRTFLTEVEQAVPADLDIHLVLDNYATDKAPPVKAWLARHPRYHLHFTPTSASWLKQVERWFALLGDNQIKRGVHRSIHDLKADITTFIQVHNADPKRSHAIAPTAWRSMPPLIKRTSDTGPALTQTDGTGQWSSLARMASADLVQTTGLGTALRKRMNSTWRWRCMQRPMTVPSSTLSAANRVVVPCRL
jgi:hypothetical protein